MSSLIIFQYNTEIKCKYQFGKHGMQQLFRSERYTKEFGEEKQIDIDINKMICFSV